MSSPASKAAFRTFAWWACGVGIAFFGVYPTLNWLTTQRASTYGVYMDWELAIPFFPEFAWIYLSMYALFPLPPFLLEVSRLHALGKQLIWATLFCGILFILLPARLGYVRVVPDHGLYSGLFDVLFKLDAPHNLAPSLHVVYSAIIIGSIVDALKSRRLQAFFIAWLILLCVSTVLVHQHHLIDVLSGLAVAALFRSWIRVENNNENLEIPA